jgi:hypothetical protein
VQEPEIAIHGGPEGGGGAVAGPRTGERVPREGERAVVVRIRDDALGPESVGTACAAAWISPPPPAARVDSPARRLVDRRLTTTK